MKTFLSLALVIFVSFSSFSQTDPYSEDVKTCIKQNGTYDFYAKVVDEMYAMLKKQYTDQNVPTEMWKELGKAKSSSMDELSQMLVSAYRGYFSHEDIKKMNALYKSKTGQTMIYDAHNLTEADKVVLGQFYESDTGKKLLSSQDEMNKLLSKISEMWSSEMYRNAVSDLSQKGFKLQQ